MGRAKLLEPPNETTSLPEVGDWVWVLFWSPHELPDGRDAGSWQVINVRAVSSGKMVVVDLAGTAPPGGGNSPSGLFFAEQNDVFTSREAAMAASRNRKPPAPAAVSRP